MNNPFVTKFAADAGDIVYYYDEPITLDLKKDGVTLLHEYYEPDTDNYIRVRGLAGIVSQSLYGTLAPGDQTSTGKGVFSIHVNGAATAAISETVYSMRMRNPRDTAGTRTVMSATEKTVAYRGLPMIVTVIGQVQLVLLNDRNEAVVSTTIGTSGTITAYDLSGFIDNNPTATWIRLAGGDMTVRILPTACEDCVPVRFLNRYDMPESLTAAYMEDKPSASDSQAVMNGLRTRFDVQSAAEYTLRSGRLHFAEQYDTWHDLLTARKAQVMLGGEWHDIIITKSNYTRHRRTLYGSEVTVSFQTANPRLLL